ncbi:unnamed protein product [Larinioides sclopetarius]|uniref:Uncharacterized protein n=1 Tax=Larinioides sclopetarius TaxID=280406 RepID=A0AAV2BVD5_9ARAC
MTLWAIPSSSDTSSWISCQIFGNCPPCSDVNGKKQYCVIHRLFSYATCMSGIKKGGRCYPEGEVNGAYRNRPPCEEGLTCSNDKVRAVRGSLASRPRSGRPSAAADVAPTVEQAVQSMSAVSAHGECSARGSQECRTEVSGEHCE